MSGGQAACRISSNKCAGALIVLLAAGAIVLAGRAAWGLPADSSTVDDSQFRATVARFIDSDLRLHPERATEDGDHRFDSRLSVFSPSAIAARISHARDWKERFSRWHGALSASNEADREWLISTLDEELLWNEEVKFYRSDPGLYMPTGAVDSLIKRDFVPAAQRMDSVAARERAAGCELDRGRAEPAHP